MTGVVRPVVAPPCWPNHAPDPGTGRCERCGEPSTLYDEWANWYEDRMVNEQPEMLADVIGLVMALTPPLPIDARAVDLCCGPGLVSVQLTATGWLVVGVDASSEMVRHARGRLADVVHRPVAETGLDAASVPFVLSTLSHTDARWSDVVDEAHRLLSPGGTFVYVGTHPAFVGPHALVRPMDGTLLLYPGLYGDNTWRQDAPGFGVNGMRSKVGAWHLSLTELFAPLADGRWDSIEMVEGRSMGGRYPVHIAFRAVKG